MTQDTLANYPDQRCFYCGVLGPVTKDHYVAASKGGKGRANIVLCCATCNHTKGTRDGDAYIAWLASPEGRAYYHKRRWHEEIVDNGCPLCISKRNSMRRKWLEWYERKWGADALNAVEAP